MRISRQLAIVICLLPPGHCRGRGLSDQADPVDRAVSAGRPERHHRARDRPAHVRCWYAPLFGRKFFELWARRSNNNVGDYFIRDAGVPVLRAIRSYVF